jgi:hypothetical protein
VMTSQCTFDSQDFLNHIMTLLLGKIFLRRGNLHASRVHCHLDNCRIHSAQVTESCLAEYYVLHVPHLSCSSDLTPLYFWLCHQMNTSLASQTFEGPDEFLETIMTFLPEIYLCELSFVLTHWIRWLRWVLESNWDSYHE